MQRTVKRAHLASAQLVALVALLQLPAQAWAGVLLVGEISTADAPKGTQKSETYLDKHAVRMRVDGATHPVVMIFRADKELLLIVDEKGKTYQEIGRKEVEQLGQAFARIEQQLKSLPPEQRKAMEQMLKKQGMGGSDNTPLKWKKGSGKSKVGKWTCEQHTGFQGKAKKFELWTTTPTALGLDKSVSAPMKKMLAFTKTLMDKLPAPWRNAMAGTQQTLANRMFSKKGVAVQVVTYEDGKEQSKWRMESVTKKALPKSLFEPPKGFSKQSLGLNAMPK